MKPSKLSVAFTFLIGLIFISLAISQVLSVNSSNRLFTFAISATFGICFNLHSYFRYKTTWHAIAGLLESEAEEKAKREKVLKMDNFNIIYFVLAIGISTTALRFLERFIVDDALIGIFIAGSAGSLFISLGFLWSYLLWKGREG